jgi:hypothetical protein
MQYYHCSSALFHTISDRRSLRKSLYCIKEVRSEDVLVRLKGAVWCYRVWVDFTSPLIVARLVYEIILEASLFQLRIMGIRRQRVPECFLQFADGAVCRYSLQDSAASLLTFRALSIMSNEVLDAVQNHN